MSRPRSTVGRAFHPSKPTDAPAIVAAKKNLRLLTAGTLADPRARGILVKSVAGGFLKQERDNAVVDDLDLKCVTKRQPSEAELAHAWAAQQKQIKEIPEKAREASSKTREEAMAKLREAPQEERRELMQQLFSGFREKAEAQQKETDAKVLAVLSAKQKAGLEGLKGKPFTLVRETRNRTGAQRGAQGRGTQGRGNGDATPSRGTQGRGGAAPSRGTQGRGNAPTTPEKPDDN